MIARGEPGAKFLEDLALFSNRLLNEEQFLRSNLGYDSSGYIRLKRFVNHLSDPMHLSVPGNAVDGIRETDHHESSKFFSHIWEWFLKSRLTNAHDIAEFQCFFYDEREFTEGP